MVPQGDIGALANAIISLLKKPEEMKKMGESGHKRALREFSPLKYIERLEKLYIKLLEQKGLLTQLSRKKSNLFVKLK